MNTVETHSNIKGAALKTQLDRKLREHTKYAWGAVVARKIKDIRALGNPWTVNIKLDSFIKGLILKWTEIAQSGMKPLFIKPLNIFI
nr:hypothetical protein [Sporomusa termitida]